jgi:hypothetical protein
MYQFFGLASVSWNGIISLDLLLTLRKPFLNRKKYVKFYHLFVWGISLASTFVLMFVKFVSFDFRFFAHLRLLQDGKHLYGASGDGTCWISVPCATEFTPMQMFIERGFDFSIFRVLLISRIDLLPPTDHLLAAFACARCSILQIASNSRHHPRKAKSFDNRSNDDLFDRLAERVA